jgi:hypothetical protein
MTCVCVCIKFLLVVTNDDDDDDDDDDDEDNNNNNHLHNSISSSNESLSLEFPPPPRAFLTSTMNDNCTRRSSNQTDEHSLSIHNKIIRSDSGKKRIYVDKKTRQTKIIVIIIYVHRSLRFLVTIT